jgi:ABC-type multidrug transport system permease subunit
MYSVYSYYLARLLVDTPIQLLLPLFFSLIIYFQVGLTITVTQFSHFYLGLLLLAMSCSGIGYVLSTIIHNEEATVPMSTLVMMPSIQFGGFLVNAGSIPGWLSWLQYLSPIRYALEAISRNEFETRSYNAAADERNPIPYMGFEMGTFKCYLLLGMMAIGFRVMALGCLKFLVSKF